MKEDSADSTVNKQPKLQELNLRDTNVSIEAAAYLKELLVTNTTLTRVNLDLNTNVPA